MSIVCGTDFSTNARQASEVAAALAARMGQSLVLVHVVDGLAVAADAAVRRTGRYPHRSLRPLHKYNSDTPLEPEHMAQPARHFSTRVSRRALAIFSLSACFVIVTALEATAQLRTRVYASGFSAPSHSSRIRPTVPSSS